MKPSMTHLATRCIILLLNLKNKFGWVRDVVMDLCSHINWCSWLSSQRAIARMAKPYLSTIWRFIHIRKLLMWCHLAELKAAERWKIMKQLTQLGSGQWFVCRQNEKSDWKREGKRKEKREREEKRLRREWGKQREGIRKGKREGGNGKR